MPARQGVVAVNFAPAIAFYALPKAFQVIFALEAI
jgi:hypothetical protein